MGEGEGEGGAGDVADFAGIAIKFPAGGCLTGMRMPGLKPSSPGTRLNAADTT
jgi:hypothetical protein